MTTTDHPLPPDEVGRWAHRAGLPLEDARLGPVAATASHIQRVVGVLRAIDFAETAPTAHTPVPADRPTAPPATEEDPRRATV